MAHKDKRILFIHPEAAMYRREFFDLLNMQLNITFAFTGGHNWVVKIPESKQWRYKNFKPYRFIGYQGEFSPGIFFEIIKGYDVIVSSIITSFPTHLSFIVAKILRKKFVLFDEIWTWPNTLLAKLAFPYARFIARHADAILVAGSKAKEYFVQKLGVYEKKVFICPNSSENLSRRGLDLRKLSKIESAVKPNNEIIILYLSRVVEYKNLDCLIMAFSRLEKIFPKAKLVIGGDGPFLDFCKNLSKRLNLRNIIFLGYVRHSESQYYYKLCDIFVLPGKFMPQDSITCESWGLVLNEVIQFGKPIIATTSIGAAFDLVESGRNGFRVKENNVFELENAIKKLVASKKLRDEMGLASQMIKNNFTAQVQAREFSRCCMEL